MNVDGYLNFSTKINTKNFTKGIESIKSQMNGVKSAVSRFGKTVAGAFSTAMIVDFGKKAINASAEINASNSQMEQSFGSLFSSADEAMRRVAESSGIVQTRLQGVGTSIYAFAKTSGMDSVSALNMMEEALQVTADSAAYYDRSLEETSESLQSFLKGNFENDSALGLSCTETTRNIAANKLYGKSFQQLSESQKQLALLQMVKDANALSGALGQASREADGWENVMGNLKESWRQFIAIIGQPLLEIAVKSVKKLTEALNFLAEKARSVTGVLAELFGQEQENTSSVTSNISASVSEQNELTESVEETAETEEKSVAGFDEINTLTEKNSESAEKSEKTTEEVSIMPAVVTDENAVEEQTDGFSDKIQSLIKPIQLAWTANSPELIADVQTAFENIKGLAGSVAESFEKIWTNGSGERYIGNILGLLDDFFKIIGDISGALQSAWDDGGRGSGLIQSYFDRWNALFEFIRGLNKAFQEVWNDGTGEKICADILEIITNINNIVSNLRNRFTEAWSENKTGVAIFSGVLGIISVISGAISSLTGKTAEWAGKLNFSPVLKSIAGLFKSIKPFAENVFDILLNVYEKVLLPFGKWTIEKAVPASIDLFSGAIDLLNSVITVFKPFGKWLYDSFLKPVAEWTGGVIVSIIKGVTSALKGISDWISEHQTLVQDFIIIVASIGTAFAFAGVIQGVISAFTAIGGVTGILATAELGLQTVTTALAGAFTALASPAVLIPLLIGAIIAIGVLLVKHWDEVKAFAVGMWESIQETLYSFFEAWETGWNAIKDFTSKIWDKIKDFFAKAWKKITEIFRNIGDWFSERWGEIVKVFSVVGDWFSEKFRNAWDNITEIFRNIGGWFSDRWGEIVKVFSVVGDWFSEKFHNAWDNITEIFQNIGGWFSDRWGEIVNVFSAVGDWFSEKFRNAWDNIKTAFSEVNGFFRDVWNGITSVFSHVSDWFKNTFSSAWEAVRNVFSKGGEIFTGITDGIFNTFKTIVNGLIDGINWVIEQPFNAINWALDGVRGVEIMGWYPFDWLPSIDVPQIPHLANGTVVPANYGNFLAVLGDNKREMEIVSPLSTIEKAVENAIKKNGNSAVSEIHVHVELDGREIGRTAVRAINQDKMRRGG
ncbi:MAG: hypothetical protein NC177_15585 [Ruminococcus flavefaciens]|nr:hypothetical protein [Ruminococcus flavefaciens]